MHVTSSTLTTPYAESGPSAAQIKRSDDAFLALFEDKPSDPAEELREITRGGVTGMMAWKIEQMKKEAAERSLAARGLSVDDVQAMPPQQRLELQEQIMKDVAEAVKKAIETDMNQKQAEAQRRAELAETASARGGLDIFA